VHLRFTHDFFNINVLESFKNINFCLFFRLAILGTFIDGLFFVFLYSKYFVSNALLRLESSSNNEFMVSRSMSKFDNLRLLLVQVITIFSIIVDLHLRGL
jgi:hypothetical protein